ncbi:MAG: polysaccharide deacetylase family protein [Bacteroidaceae bacterium]|nr:polysaccharide deacetylase family protein [Bacteroidaceae bacterium]
MIVERSSAILKHIFRDAIYRKDPSDHSVYLTFDDGPIPEVTPWVLDILDKYGIKATFFMVGDNVRKHPEVFQMVKERGHRIGNHTFNHLRSLRVRTPDYIDNIDKCKSYFNTDLFRPPHGLMRPWLYNYVKEYYRIVFHDLVTRDYAPRLSPDDILNNVKKYTRNGSIIVFHDSLKSWDRLEKALPASIEWLLEQGYEFKAL